MRKKQIPGDDKMPAFRECLKEYERLTKQIQRLEKELACHQLNQSSELTIQHVRSQLEDCHTSLSALMDCPVPGVAL